MRYYDAKDVLAAMAELYRHKKYWTKRHFARDKQGHGLSPDNPTAVCYCMSGAAQLFSGTFTVKSHAEDYIRKAIHELFPATKRVNIPHFNDARHRTIEHVRRVVERARELANGV